MEIMLTTAELANIVRLSPATIKRLRANGEIRGYKFRRRLRFLLSEVLADIGKAESEVEMREMILSGGPRTKRLTSLKGKFIHDYKEEPNGGCDY